MRALPLFALLGLLALAGCNQEKVILGGQPRPKLYKNIFSFSPSTSELAAKMDIEFKGRTSACDYPDPVKNAPAVVNLKPNYELLAKMKPDLIVADKALFSDEELKRATEVSGADLVTMDVHSIDDFILFIQRLAGKVGGEIRANEYADEIYNARQRAQNTVLSPVPTAAILIGDAAGGYMIAGTKTFTADLIRSAGAKIVGPEATEFVPANLEQLVVWNPDFIFINDNSKGLLSDSRLASLKAIKSRHVGAVPSAILLRAGARVAQMISRASQFLHEAK